MQDRQFECYAIQIIYALSLTFHGMILENRFVLARNYGAVLSR